ncbi:MAG: hypothetical protein Rhims3KO_09850 [Hyphomicrobiales bacterium]
MLNQTDSTPLSATTPALLTNQAPYEDRCAAYDSVRAAIAYISETYLDQPDIETIARAVGENPTILTRRFRAFAGLTPKAFLQAVTLDKAKSCSRMVSQSWELRWIPVCQDQVGCTISSSRITPCRRGHTAPRAKGWSWSTDFTPHRLVWR